MLGSGVDKDAHAAEALWREAYEEGVTWKPIMSRALHSETRGRERREHGRAQVRADVGRPASLVHDGVAAGAGEDGLPLGHLAGVPATCTAHGRLAALTSTALSLRERSTKAQHSARATTATPGVAALATTVVFHDNRNSESHQRTNIGRQGAVAGHNQYGFMIACDPHRHFFDLIVLSSCGLIDTAQQLHLIFIGQTADWVRGCVKRWSLDSLKPRSFSSTTGSGN